MAYKIFVFLHGLFVYMLSSHLGGCGSSTHVHLMRDGWVLGVNIQTVIEQF